VYVCLNGGGVSEAKGGANECRSTEISKIEHQGVVVAATASRQEQMRYSAIAQAKSSRVGESGREEEGPSSPVSHSTGFRIYDASQSRSRQSQIELYCPVLSVCQSHDPLCWLTGPMSRGVKGVKGEETTVGPRLAPTPHTSGRAQMWFKKERGVTAKELQIRSGS
jgi:hypothetical protein